MRGGAPQCRRLACGAAVLSAGAALATALAWNAIFDAVFSAKLVLSPTSRSYKDWVAPTVPLFLEVYLFNWTNADRFPAEIPELEELGPYRFREHRRHVNVTWHPANGSVSYRTQRSWFFDENSTGSLDDNITMLNIIAASAVYRSRDWGFFRQNGLAMGLAVFGQKLSVSKTAGELLFDGYEDPLLDLAKSLPSSTTGDVPLVDRFGLFYGRNNSIDTDGYMEVSTGAGSESLPGQIIRWNNYDRMPYYQGKCAEITGSAGEFMAHNLSVDGPLTMFVPDLCRTVHLEYADSGLMSGLPYNKYTMTELTFDNSTRSPENSCFCNGECAWSGTMNVSACRFGSPSFLSLPHFLHGDPDLREHVKGLNPDPEKHEFYFSVEPRLGIPLDVSAKFQFNVYIEPTPNIALFQNVPRMLFPIFWVQQSVKISDSVIAELRMVRGVLDWGGAVCACAALAFAALLTVTSCCRRNYKKTQETISLEKPKDDAELKLNPVVT